MRRGGKRRTGRKKGGTNKITSDVKQAILEAFNALGGVEYLCAVAREDPKAFCALLGKLIPVKVAGDAEDPPVLRMGRSTPRPKKPESSGLNERPESAELPRAIAGPTTRAANERNND